MNTHASGKTGEDVAAKHLAKQGYEILQRNFVADHGEIDIVAKQGGYYVFVEVKRRKTDKFGLPREAVNTQKQRTIVQTAKQWLVKNNLFGAPVRFDVVEVTDSEVTVLQDAFRATQPRARRK